jgi:hypothetical protein
MSSFLAKCNCKDDVCHCTDFLTNEPINQTKGNTTMNTQFADALRGSTIKGNVKLPMSKAQQYSKLSDFLRAASIPDREGLLDDVIANAADLPVATLRRMAKSLNAAAAAKETQSSKKAIRLRALHAAMANDGEDEQINAAVALARGELSRIGYSINDVPSDGFNAHELSEKMREKRWSDERRQTLLACCATIGLIEA